MLSQYSNIFDQKWHAKAYFHKMHTRLRVLERVFFRENKHTRQKKYWKAHATRRFFKAHDFEWHACVDL